MGVYNMKKQLLTLVAKTAEKAALSTSRSQSWWGIYEVKVPTKLQKRVK